MGTQSFMGIDIGGTGIKSAIVNTETGTPISERFRTKTPKKSTPKKIRKSLKMHIEEHKLADGPIGIGFPGTISKNGIVSLVGNLHKKWIGCEIEKYLGKKISNPIKIINDADAAGIGEAHFLSKQQNLTLDGVTLFLTLGTGVGSALLHDSTLIPRTEFGHTHLPSGILLEHYINKRARKKNKLSYKKWAKRLNEALAFLDKCISPDTIILGGGIVKKCDKWFKHIENENVKLAKLGNNAGIVGAALHCSDCLDNNLIEEN